MKKIIKKEKGVTMVALVITVIILIILTSMLIYNATDSAQIKALTNLYNDIELLREKVSEYYNEYGKIPAQIKYTNTSELSSVLSSTNDTGDFYIIDLEAMQGISLNYGKDYEKAKAASQNAATFKDIYIINENSQNIFYVQGVTITKGDTTQTYYTDYTEPDNTEVDLKYIDGILIPDGYYYIGKTKDNSGNESIVISNNRKDKVDSLNTNQYTWTKQISKLETKPGSVKLDTTQKEEEFLMSVNANQGYFKNSEGKVQYTIVDEENWSKAYTKETKYTDIKGDTVIIPKGCKVSLASTMNILDAGFVIKDSNENEWVWVIVPKNIFKTAKSDTDYDNIKADLENYTQDYKSQTGKDEYYNGCGIESETKYKELYNRMLTSIYNKNGFWISRYEAGIDGSDKDTSLARITHTDINEKSPKAVSKKDQITYGQVYCSEAQKLAENAAKDVNNDYKSSLLFGIQWDLICKFIEVNETKLGATSEIRKNVIKVDSTEIGNYKNATFNINSKNAKEYSGTAKAFVTANSTKESGTTTALTTGSSEQNKTLNIYDIAGNEWEWTLEKSTNTQYPSICVGGEYYDAGTTSPMAKHLANTTTTSYLSRGFRITLY